MKMKAWVIVGTVGLAFGSLASELHPRLYVSDGDLDRMQQTVATEPWAQQAYAAIKKTIDPYVERHQTDPEWIVSRLAMYWKDGERYTQCYLKKQNWDYGKGNAPVPTVRLPGMRTWNEYVNVPLEERTPYNETGDMKGLSKTDPTKPMTVVPYKESGHMIRQNNAEILALAEQSAFVYWMTGDEKYARFSADIFWTWMLGTYYMEPPLCPDNSLGPGGYKPGGICGYYDYEQIHDDRARQAAAIYDFLYDYLNEHPAAHQQELGKPLPVIAGTVFKRFVELGMIRGGRDGNWNVNGWASILRPMLVLEGNDAYDDGRGLEYYLHYYTTESTKYHRALPEMVATYDAVTGLWPEAPGYAFGTIASLLEMAIPIYRQGTDTVGANPMMQKAALAVFPWMDARGNLVVFGDSRGGPVDFGMFENLLAYYTWEGDTTNATAVATALQKGIEAGQYDRAKADWKGLCVNVAKLPASDHLPAPRTAYSETHRHIVMKNGNDEKNGLMAILYGGSKGSHLTSNGLAMQLYGKGWALAPDAAGYESYWSKDYAYHQSETGANTILPGYTRGPIGVEAVEPAPAAGAFTNDRQISDAYQFADVSAAEKRRLVGLVRTSPTTGYYVDIFRSEQSDNDYLYHNLGNTLTLENPTGGAIALKNVSDLGKEYSPGYAYFSQLRKGRLDGDLCAQWTISTVSPAIHMQMWMLGQPGRTVFQMDAPYTTIKDDVTPNGVCKTPNPTPSLIVRQDNKDGWENPFIAVFEPYEGDARSVQQVEDLKSGKNFVGLKVTSRSGRMDMIFSSTDDKTYTPGSGVEFSGTYGIVSGDADGLVALYLGRGTHLSGAGYGLKAAEREPVSAGLETADEGWIYSADAEIIITLPAPKQAMRLLYQMKGEWVSARPAGLQKNGGVAAKLPKGYDVPLKWVAADLQP
jgi:hypothetical protein